MPQIPVRVFREASGASPALKWLKELKKTDTRAYARCIALILRLGTFGSELEMPDSKPLGGGLFELRARKGKSRYRILYFFCGKEAVCLSHGVVKKQSEVSQSDLVSANKRKQLAEANMVKYTVNFKEKI